MEEMIIMTKILIIITKLKLYHLHTNLQLLMIMLLLMFTPKNNQARKIITINNITDFSSLFLF